MQPYAVCQSQAWRMQSEELILGGDRLAKFCVGDEVIVSEGVRNCIHGADPEMIEMIGRIVHITDIWKDDGCGYVEYEIEEDGRYFTWCDQCFEYPIQEDDDVPSVSDDEFEHLLSSMF